MSEVSEKPVVASRAGLGMLRAAWSNYQWRRGLLSGLRDPRGYPERVRELRALIDLPKDKLSTDWLWRVQALAEKAMARLPPDDPLRPDLKIIFSGALWTVQNRARSW